MSDLVSGALYAPSLVEVTTRQLREEILSGQLQPGQRLIEEQIRQRFSISRAPLREALRLLAQQGLIEHLPRRGARVTEWSATDIEQLFGIRAVLERHAAVLTFPIRDGDAQHRLAQVRERLEQMRAAEVAGDQLQKDDAHGPSTPPWWRCRQPAARSGDGADPVEAAAADGDQPPARGQAGGSAGGHPSARAVAPGSGDQRPRGGPDGPGGARRSSVSGLRRPAPGRRPGGPAGWIGGYMSVPDVGAAVRDVTIAVPSLNLDLLFNGLANLAPLLATAVPLGVNNFLEAMSNVESAAAAGDSYNLRSVLLAVAPATPC